MAAVQTLEFAPPRPGSWALDATHFTRPVTRFIQEIFLPEFSRGFGESLARYGLLLDHLDYAFVNGFPYYCPRPVVDPGEADARLARAAAALETKLWREDLRVWDEHAKPDCIRRNLAVQAIDPASLPADELAAHVEVTRENAKHQLYVHHLYNVPALLPVGDFLAHAVDWTGRPPAELLTLFRGATPVSRGAEAELQQAGRAVNRHPGAQSLLGTRSDPAETLAGLLALPGEAGVAVRAYVDLVGYRLVNGEDIAEPYGLELPEVLVGAIRAAGAGPAGPQDAAAALLAEVRDDVPAGGRELFDELLEEARATYRLRDERGLHCDLWGYGLARRALLAAGERLAREGRIARADHLVYAGHEETRALLAGEKGPDGDELAERAGYREASTYAGVPEQLGDPPGPPPSLDSLPAASSRFERAMGTAVQALFVAPPRAGQKGVVRGLPVSPGIFEGPARVIHGTDDFARLQTGDVLVTNSTTASFNVVLPLIGAIVTDRGGVLSHAAVVAREFGIPAVVGTTDGTALIPDGALVRVDGAAGEAVIL